VGGVILGAFVSPPSDPFWGYPPWLVVLGLTLAVALAIWILGKLLKWALWLLLIAVLVGGLGWAVWLLIR
jgi:hypothetical protein